jgi:hypothetical protein
MKAFLPCLFALSLLAPPLAADTPLEPGWSVLLVPIYTEEDVPGFGGSLWRTEFWMRNNGNVTTEMALRDCPIICLPVQVVPDYNFNEIPTEVTYPPSANPARLIFIRDVAGADVTASLRLWDVSREADDAGTEIPVLRESDLFTSTAHLTAVPLHGRFRLMLRVYDVVNAESQFRVRVYGMEEGDGPNNPLMEFDMFAGLSHNEAFRVYPAYAQYEGITDILMLPVVHPAQVRIEVEPLTPGSLFWAFVAVTNNDTQRVTLVTPQ